MEFTRRDEQVLAFIAEDIPHKEIRQALGLSQSALSRIIAALYKKTGTFSRDELVAYWKQWNHMITTDSGVQSKTAEIVRFGERHSGFDQYKYPD
jgi:DNA-binding CsgD family transcriptional regulator